jgi:hypothetical protein
MHQGPDGAERPSRSDSAAVPGIGQAELRKVAAILRHLSNLAAWTALRQNCGFSADETATALSWATEVLIHSLLDKESRGRPDERDGERSRGESGVHIDAGR